MMASCLLTALESDEVHERLIDALSIAYCQHQGIKEQICDDQGALTLKHALHRWLDTFLLLPDERTGQLLMPLIMLRFEVYLQQLQRRSLSC